MKCEKEMNLILFSSVLFSDTRSYVFCFVFVLKKYRKNKDLPRNKDLRGTFAQDVKQRLLLTFAIGLLRHLVKIGKPLNNKFV